MFTLWILAVVFVLTSGRVPLNPKGSKIIGGEDAPAHLAPHMVSLVHQSFFLNQVCGGSLISKRLVLTAAHCITPFTQGRNLVPTFYGRVGTKTWFANGTVINFESYHIHPGWDEANIKNDVGVLVLREPVKLGEGVGLIEMENDWVGGNVPCYVTGWGRTGPYIGEDFVILAPTPDNLQSLNVSTLTTKQCAGILADPIFSAAPAINETIEICTFHSIGYGMCNGDSGSALVSLITGRQIGIVSWGFPCAVGAPDVYARVDGELMQRFIKNKMEEFSD